MVYSFSPENSVEECLFPLFRRRSRTCHLGLFPLIARVTSTFAGVRQEHWTFDVASLQYLDPPATDWNHIGGHNNPQKHPIFRGDRTFLRTSAKRLQLQLLPADAYATVYSDWNHSPRLVSNEPHDDSKTTCSSHKTQARVTCTRSDDLTYYATHRAGFPL